MTKDKLVEGLNKDLAAELGTILRYLYQSSKATGFSGMELREMLSKEIGDELGHAQFLADKIVALGGEPVVEPLAFEKISDVRRMLELDIDLERKDIANYKRRAEEADEFGDIGLKVKLEEIAADETNHAEELERILRGL
jgi:bacterioferritin